MLVRNDALLPRELDALCCRSGRRLIARRPAPVRRAAGPQGRPGERLAPAFEQLGPVAIKLGQLLSTRADIFGDQFAEDLARLKDRLPPFPIARRRREVERALGRPVEALFADFGEPVAAASLAQAHPACLADGRKVAVKVLRPGIERRVAADSAVLGWPRGWSSAWCRPLRRLEPAAFVATVDPRHRAGAGPAAGGRRRRRARRGDGPATAT